MGGALWAIGGPGFEVLYNEQGESDDMWGGPSPTSLLTWLYELQPPPSNRTDALHRALEHFAPSSTLASEVLRRRLSTSLEVVRYLFARSAAAGPAANPLAVFLPYGGWADA